MEIAKSPRSDSLVRVPVALAVITEPGHDATGVPWRGQRALIPKICRRFVVGIARTRLIRDMYVYEIITLRRL